MRIILDIMMIYIAIGMIGAILVERATNKYFNEIEKEVGEDLNRRNLKILMLITIVTWPKKLIWLIGFVVTGIRMHIEQQKN